MKRVEILPQDRFYRQGVMIWHVRGTTFRSAECYDDDFDSKFDPDGCSEIPRSPDLWAWFRVHGIEAVEVTPEPELPVVKVTHAYRHLSSGKIRFFDREWAVPGGDKFWQRIRVDLSAFGGAA